MIDNNSFIKVSAAFKYSVLSLCEARGSFNHCATCSVQSKPNQTKPNQTKPNQTKQNQTKQNKTIHPTRSRKQILERVRNDQGSNKSQSYLQWHLCPIMDPEMYQSNFKIELAHHSDSNSNSKPCDIN